jgi:hypothetical protein
VFALMKMIYTSDLPIYDTELIGMFPLPSGKHVVNSEAVVAYETHIGATHIPWRSWGRESEGLLWTKLPYKSVDPRFA